MYTPHDNLRAIRWQDDHIALIDQRKLPHVHETLICRTASDVATAIREMVVRGAPAIGISAAYGVVLAAYTAYAKSPTDWQTLIQADLQLLAQARPTAVNLHWALAKMQAHFSTIMGDPIPTLLACAQAIHTADIAANQCMGELGATLLPEGCRVLTHCNTGSLATGGYGTALGVIRHGYASGKIQQVYADETRPWLQGARLTAWELVEDQIPVTLLADCAAAALMRQGKVDWVIVGADRITANGDTANKIGTYSLAVLARQHGVKFMVVAPVSTIDMQLATGDAIEIEERTAMEVLTLSGKTIAAQGAQAWNPVFDVTPAHLIDVLVTERGICSPPSVESIHNLMVSKD
jgi:methylthioribose-1-phosphate isomerase